MKISRLRLFVHSALVGVLLCGGALATTRYVAQSAGAFSGGTACNGQTAITPATFNGLTLSAGDITWLCGTITIAGTNVTGLTIGQSGTSGNPILINFDTGAILQSAYFASSAGSTAAGGITLGNGHSWITIDGQHTGTIQNTANGSSLANQQASTGISGFNCNHCTVQNLSILNIYVNVNGNNTLGDSSVARAIDPNGPNWTISGNTFSNCGWCVFSSYANNDTNEQWYSNTFTQFGHAFAFAAASGVACIAPCLFLHDNDMNAGTSWDAVGCFAHKDGLHLFGNGSTSTMDGLYIYNNYFHGDWGLCPTGFIFAESGGSAAGLKSWAVWNNVGVVVNTSFVNTNGWMNISSGISGTQQWLSNTIIGNCQNDNSAGFVMHLLSALTYEDNAASCIGDPVDISSSTVTAANFNFYGANVCQNGGNCFIWNGSFAGSFSAWKTACSCDANAVSNLTPLLNADGSPQAGSPVIGAATNLSSSASGNLSSLQSDTTKGGTRSPLARPGGSTAWDIGAYQFQAAASPTDMNVKGLTWRGLTVAQ